MIAAIVAAGVALLLAVLAVGYLLARPLPRTRGRVVVTGLREATTVVRDKHGVVHVEAANLEDAAFAMGYVHAQERLWQLDLNRRVASGRISEIAGEDGLAADRFIRRIGLRRVAQEEARLLSSEPRRMLEAYAAGVNEVIDSGTRLPLEFRLLRIRPEPWEPVDSIVAVKLLALGLSLNWDSELQRLRLLQAVGPQTAARLELVYPESNPTILAETVRQAGRPGDALELYHEAVRWLPSASGASNAWVLSGERTATGRPLLCNDPHLRPSLPSIWFAAHVRVLSDFESTGVTYPGQPFPIIGHNQRVAWGFTNSFADCQDLVIEEFDGVAGERFRTENGWRETRLAREVIRVKDGSDAIEDVLITRHGPIVERCDDSTANRWLGVSLQWTALTPANASASMLELQRAGDWDSFRNAFRSLDAPSQNAVYADVDGHIGYFCNARIPVRRREPSGLPVPGWTGDALWQRFLSVDEVPQVLDPPDQLVVTANNRVVGDEFPHYIATDYMAGYRARRLHQLLDEDRYHVGDMRRIQMDLVCLPAQQVSILLAEVTCRTNEAERMRKRLVAWDGRMLADRIEPTVYEAFMLRLAEHALRPLCGDAWAIAAGVDLHHPLLEYPGNLAGRITPALLQRWESDDDSILRGKTTWDDVASRAMEDAVTDLHKRHGAWQRWRWGRVHRLPLEHPLAVSRLLRVLLNAPRIPVGGSTDTVMATSFIPSQPFATRLFAPSWRQVIDVGNWESGCTGVLFPGQSGHRVSRHHHDLSGRWRTNRQLPLTWGDAAFGQGRKLRLEPRSTALVSGDASARAA